jgi:hypothetical protein
MMKKYKIKIVGVLFCLLLLASAVPITGAVNERETRKMLQFENKIDFYSGSSLIQRIITVDGCNLEIVIQGGHGVKAMITNSGMSKVKNITWSLSVTGGFAGKIHKKINGIINLSPKGSVTIGTGTFLGFGPLSVTIKIADVEQTVIGTQVLDFTLFKKNTAESTTKSIMVNKTNTLPLNTTVLNLSKTIDDGGAISSGGGSSSSRKTNPTPPTYYTLIITIIGNGTVTPSSASKFLKGTKVDIIAIPDTGWMFTSWSGDGSRSTSSITVSMNADKTLTAHFSRKTVGTYTLTVTAGTGGSTTPSGAHSYPSGTLVDCSATPNVGYHFTGWSGAYTGTNNPYQISLKANAQLTAKFALNPPNTYTLTTTVVGTGCSVTKNPNQAAYTNGAVVTLTAVSAVGWTFTSWSGAVSGTSKSVTVTMNANKTVTATFTQNKYSLTVSVAAGSGTVSKTPNYSTYTHGTVVTLTAIPATNYTFGGWGGNVTGTTSSTTITMTGNKAITATFVKKQSTAKQVKTFMVAYFTPTVTQRQYIASHVDLLDLGGDDGSYATIAPMKTLNPALKVITYRELNGVYGPPSTLAQEDWPEVNAHEDWFLHSLSGSRLVTAGTSYHYSMNPNPAVGWNQHGANAIAQYLSQYPLLDGVFLDNAGRFWGSFGASGNILNQNGNHLYLSDIAQNIQTMYPFSGSVETGDWVYSSINTIKNTSPGKIIMGNSGTSWDLSNNLGMWLCIESFSDDSHWGTQDYQLYMVNACEAGITSNTNIAVITTHSLAPTAANREAIRFWAVSHYTLFCLVLKDPAKSYFCFQSSYGSPYPADTGYWYPEIDTPLGDPLGPKQLIAGNANDGVYMRRFQHATILRNLSMDGGQGTHKTYTVTVDGIQYTLGPEQGKIILT